MECRYSVEVLHVKRLSPLVKDDIFIILHLINVKREWVCDTVERGMEEVHSKFQYELLGFKKGRG